MPRQDVSNLRLSADHFEQVRSILQKFAPSTEVWAYGSRVTGTGHEASDLDLVLRNSTDLGAEYPGLFDLKDAFVESNLPIHVDVMDWARVPESFREEIEKAYVVVQ